MTAWVTGSPPPAPTARLCPGHTTRPVCGEVSKRDRRLKSTVSGAIHETLQHRLNALLWKTKTAA